MTPWSASPVMGRACSGDDDGPCRGLNVPQRLRYGGLIPPGCWKGKDITVQGGVRGAASARTGAGKDERMARARRGARRAGEGGLPWRTSACGVAIAMPAILPTLWPAVSEAIGSGPPAVARRRRSPHLDWRRSARLAPLARPCRCGRSSRTSARATSCTREAFENAAVVAAGATAWLDQRRFAASAGHGLARTRRAFRRSTIRPRSSSARPNW